MSAYAKFTDAPSALAVMKVVDKLRAEIQEYLDGHIIGAVNYPVAPHRVRITAKVYEVGDPYP